MFQEENDFDAMLLKSNLIEAKSLKELFEKEKSITVRKVFELEKNYIKGDFDYAHLKEIHKFLFEDIYLFAGMDRADIGLQGTFLKGDQHFVPGNQLKKYSKEIFDDLKNKNFLKNCKSIDEFSKEAAYFLMELNALHPFREGNGRTQRIFMNYLAKNAGFKMDLNLISQNTMILASKEASKLNPKVFEKLIKENILELSKKDNTMDKENSNLSLSITSTEKLRPELQKIFKTDVEANNGIEISTLVNTLDHVDKLVNLQNKNDLKFPNDNEAIGLKIKIDEEKKFDLNIPMGADNFSKGLDHLVAVGSNDISREKITEKEKETYKEIVEKFGRDDNSKNLQDSQIFDKFLNGGLQSIQAFASIGGDEMKEFSNSFIKSFQVLNISGITKSVSPNIQANMTKDIANLDKKLKQITENLSPKKDKEKELTNYKNLEHNR